MKYSAAAFTLALALLAANNDVADARVNLRGRKAGHRRLRHLKNTDTTGDDALNRATPAVSTTVTAAFIADEDRSAVIEEESVGKAAKVPKTKTPKETKAPKESKTKDVVEEITIVKEDTVTSQKSISSDDVSGETTEEESGKGKSHMAQIDNMADTAATSDAEEEECKVRTFLCLHIYILISILPPVNVSHAEFDCIASNSPIIRSFLLSPQSYIIYIQQGKKCPKTEDDAAARADEEPETVKTPKSLRGSDVATDEAEAVEGREESGKGKKSKEEETETMAEGGVEMVVEEQKKSKKKKKDEGDVTDETETQVVEDDGESSKASKKKKEKETEDVEDADAAVRADADEGTTEESGKKSKKKSKEEETEGDVEMVVENCSGKKCNKKNSAEAEARGEEVVAVVSDGEGGEEIVACKGKGCKGEMVADVAEAVAEAIEGSSEVKASKMKATKISKMSKISGDETEVSIVFLFSLQASTR